MQLQENFCGIETFHHQMTTPNTLGWTVLVDRYLQVVNIATLSPSKGWDIWSWEMSWMCYLLIFEKYTFTVL